MNQTKKQAQTQTQTHTHTEKERVQDVRIEGNEYTSIIITLNRSIEFISGSYLLLYQPRC